MCRALAILLILIPLSCLAQDSPKLPTDPPRWALLTLTQDGKLVGEVVVGSQAEIVRREYEVKVPYQATNPDGTKILAFKTEAKIQDITVQQPIVKQLTWEQREILFLDPTGARSDFETEIKRRLAKPTPVLLLTKAGRHPVYEALLKPDAIIVVVPEQSLPPVE